MYKYQMGVKHHPESASLQGHAQQRQYYCLAVHKKLIIVFEHRVGNVMYSTLLCRVMPSSINLLEQYESYRESYRALVDKVSKAMALASLCMIDFCRNVPSNAHVYNARRVDRLNRKVDMH